MCFVRAADHNPREFTRCYSITLDEGGAPPPPQRRERKLMHWGRGHRKLVASLALFGLTVQLAFSLGHFHVKDIAGEIYPSAGIAAASGAQTPENPPPVNDDPQHEDEYSNTQPNQ